MNSNIRLELEDHLLDRLKGRLQLMQPQSERIEQALTALEAVLLTDKTRKFSSEFASSGQKAAFAADFLAYGLVEQFLCDSNVEDIVIHGLKPVYIHHTDKGFVETPVKFDNIRELDLFIKKLLVFANRDNFKHIVDLELYDLGGRVNIIHSPFGPQITITKAKTEPISIIDLIERKSLSYDEAALLWLYIDGLSIRPANILIAGGPGTGKTTLLNALFSFLPEKDHLVLIEDTLELNTLLMDAVSRLESTQDLTLGDLIRNSLRMRPERIVVGEVRGMEAREMITAMNIGKYCMCTIHALTSREAIIRLQNDPMNIPEMLVNLIDVFVVLKRFHVDSRVFRVVDEISETGGMEQKKILLSPVFKYNYEQNRSVLMSPSTIYRDRLAREAGISPREVIHETFLRAAVLRALHEHNVHTLCDVTVFCRAFRKNPEDAMSRIGLNRAKVLRNAEQ